MSINVKTDFFRSELGFVASATKKVSSFTALKEEKPELVVPWLVLCSVDGSSMRLFTTDHTVTLESRIPIDNPLNEKWACAVDCRGLLAFVGRLKHGLFTVSSADGYVTITHDRGTYKFISAGQAIEYLGKHTSSETVKPVAHIPAHALRTVLSHAKIFAGKEPPTGRYDFRFVALRVQQSTLQAVSGDGSNFLAASAGGVESEVTVEVNIPHIYIPILEKFTPIQTDKITVTLTSTQARVDCVPRTAIIRLVPYATMPRVENLFNPINFPFSVVIDAAEFKESVRLLMTVQKSNKVRRMDIVVDHSQMQLVARDPLDPAKQFEADHCVESQGAATFAVNMVPLWEFLKLASGQLIIRINPTDDVKGFLFTAENNYEFVTAPVV
jgi:DNA polymerase III sliding clamp (beta) subunit (PCNA family)